MTTLFEISNDILDRKDELQTMLDSEVSPTIEQALAILDLENDLENKLIGYGHVCKQSELDLESIDSENQTFAIV